MTKDKYEATLRVIGEGRPDMSTVSICVKKDVVDKIAEDRKKHDKRHDFIDLGDNSTQVWYFNNEDVSDSIVRSTAKIDKHGLLYAIGYIKNSERHIFSDRIHISEMSLADDDSKNYSSHAAESNINMRRVHARRRFLEVSGFQYLRVFEFGRCKILDTERESLISSGRERHVDIQKYLSNLFELENPPSRTFYVEPITTGQAVKEIEIVKKYIICTTKLDHVNPVQEWEETGWLKEPPKTLEGKEKSIVIAAERRMKNADMD